MKKLAYFLTASLLAFSLSSQANVRIAESVAERLATATRAEELFLNLGLKGMNALTPAQRVSRLNSLLARGDASSEALARQFRVFEQALRSTNNVNAAFSEAFIVNGAVLNSQILSSLAASTGNQASDTISSILDGIETSQDRLDEVACNRSITDVMSPNKVAAFTNSLRTLELRKGGAVLSGASCAAELAPATSPAEQQKQRQMADAAADIAILAEAKLIANSSLSYNDAIETAYAEKMGVNRQVARQNLATLASQCNIQF